MLAPLITNIVQNLQANNAVLTQQFQQKTGNRCLTLFINPITKQVLDSVFDQLNNLQFIPQNNQFIKNPDNVDVLVDSYGGDPDAAYHIAKLLHERFKGRIRYIVPRSAKSAATLMACGGNEIIMGETSELGPLDPQIPQDDGSYISAKAVESTLALLEKHLKKGGKAGLQLATILSQRISPLHLGQYDDALNITKKYQAELLMLRMFKANEKAKVNRIVKAFATGYSHHSRVIGCHEAKQILGDGKITIVSFAPPPPFQFMIQQPQQTAQQQSTIPPQPQINEWNFVWQIYENNRNIQEVISLMKIAEQFSDQNV